MTSNGDTLRLAASAARAFASDLTADILLASTRMEHIRLTVRAGEAERLAATLERIATEEDGETDV